MEWAQQYLDRGDVQMTLVDNMNDQLDLVRDKLYDLQNNTRHSLDNSQATIDMDIRNRALMETIRVCKLYIDKRLYIYFFLCIADIYLYVIVFLDIY